MSTTGTTGTTGTTNGWNHMHRLRGERGGAVVETAVVTAFASALAVGLGGLAAQGLFDRLDELRLDGTSFVDAPADPADPEASPDGTVAVAPDDALPDDYLGVDPASLP